MKLTSRTAAILFLAVAGCSPSAEQVARRYADAVTGGKFVDAEKLSESRALEYLGAESLEGIYKRVPPHFTVGPVVVTGNRAVAPLNSEKKQNEDSPPCPLVLKKSEAGWRVFDCCALSLATMKNALGADFDRALSGIALLKDNACDADAVISMEALILTEKGSAAYEQGAYEKATEALQRAVQLRNTARARYLLGYVYRDNKAVTNNTQRAVDEFKAAVNLEPQNAEYHSALADAYRQNNSLSGAMAEFEQALTLDPTSKQTRFFYGLALMQKDRYAEAARQFQAVMDADPNYRNVSEVLRYATLRASYSRRW